MEGDDDSRQKAEIDGPHEVRMHRREQVEVLRADEERELAPPGLKGDLELDEIVLHLGHGKRTVIDAARLGAGQRHGEKIVVVDASEVELPLVAGTLGNIRGGGAIHVDFLRQPVLQRPAVEHGGRQLLKHQPGSCGAHAAETRTPGRGHRLDTPRGGHCRPELHHVGPVWRWLKAKRLPGPQAGAVLVLESQRGRIVGHAQVVDRWPEQRGIETRRQIRITRYAQRERPPAPGRHGGKRQLDRVPVLVGVLLELPTDELSAAIVELRQNEVALDDDGSGPVGRDRDNLRSPGRGSAPRAGVGSHGRRRYGTGYANRRQPTRRRVRISLDRGDPAGWRIEHGLDRRGRADPPLVQHQHQE